MRSPLHLCGGQRTSSGADALLPMCRSWDRIQLTRLGSRCPYPLGHLAGLQIQLQYHPGCSYSKYIAMMLILSTRQYLESPTRQTSPHPTMYAGEFLDWIEAGRPILNVMAPSCGLGSWTEMKRSEQAEYIPSLTTLSKMLYCVSPESDVLWVRLASLHSSCC